MSVRSYSQGHSANVSALSSACVHPRAPIYGNTRTGKRRGEEKRRGREKEKRKEEEKEEGRIVNRMGL